ncbi:MAG: glycosyltransferase [Candidatus Neoclostridium sp.]
MINLLFAGNDKVLDGILTCLLSIFHRSSLTEPVQAYVLTMNLQRVKPEYVAVSDEKIEFLRSVMKEYGESNDVRKIDVTELYESEFAYCPNEGAYCSPYTLLRLFADEVGINADKLLYLDADIMFNRDIALLYDVDVSGVEYAAARDHYGKFLVSPNYVNGGVMLFNMVEVKKNGLLKKARALIKRKKLPFADQSAIIRSTTKKKMLPQRFNDQKFLHKHTVVRHFSKRLFYFPYPHTDNVKQWHVEKVRKVFGYTCFDDVYEKYDYYKKLFEVMQNENGRKSNAQ